MPPGFRWFTRSGTIVWNHSSFESRLSDRKYPFGSENSSTIFQNSASDSFGASSGLAARGFAASDAATATASPNARIAPRVSLMRASFGERRLMLTRGETVLCAAAPITRRVPVHVPVLVLVRCTRRPAIADSATSSRSSRLQELPDRLRAGQDFEKTGVAHFVIPEQTMAGARNHRELKTWQFAHAVRLRFHRLLLRPEVRSDREFCSETRRAARSACRNLAEGFYRWEH